jgi:transcriptional regulator GlxA family with amidase domain
VATAGPSAAAGRAAGRNRLRHVVTDQLTDIPKQSLYLPEPRDDRLRTLTRLLYADPADASTLTELGQAVGPSERILSRLFRTELGMHFHQWSKPTSFIDASPPSSARPPAATRPA